ncbi:tRNA1(Val) (adenine(37)-N6)-methyltransferase [Allomuricauda sp. SCSIO 65647]|uniref:tRNA1(Val) (adenine(37)-N6)-methyltransferase n=1 Tax=Allomuricauda sp. SCSIO 65647 TaxID=2908843 RepID=UPI001F31E030|nr:methyltransferase [Muricauda sp. SCSIO 65647]UJH68641.1 methyltransferase [Muricauda sp. SCSIO 65647]
MKPFRFKEFTVHQDRCAMKVGTDGVLLGAWTSLENEPDTILDVGTGTGLIALQLAQRSSAKTIDAVELDELAFEQCVENFESSPWADRLFCYHASFKEFVEEMDEAYDLIVSNPPFYSEEVSSRSKSRDSARQNRSLPFNDLIHGVSKLLSPTGSFATIVPHKEETRLIGLAVENHLFVHSITRVKATANTEVKRSLLQFSRVEAKTMIDELTLETDSHRYTEEYISLTKDFYLKM